MSVAATFCATLVDEWVRGGVRHAVISPGSRSTPLAVALAARQELQVHVVLDERSASFRALGIGLASGVPAVLCCTSGTAAAEYHAAVVEAHQAAVPLLVCTADRPPELQGVGAPQTIDQVGLFGASARWSAAPGVPDLAASGSWRSLASRALLEATGAHPGPVHLNLAFREPLGGAPDVLPAGRPDGSPWHRRVSGSVCAADLLDEVITVLGGRRVLVIAGAGIDDPRAVEDLADAARWVVFADPRSGVDAGHARVVSVWDPLLRAIGEREPMLPEAILRLGEPPASKVLEQWAAGLDLPEVVVRSRTRWIDPGHRAHLVVDAPVGDLCVGLAGLAAPASQEWAEAWHAAGRSGSAAVEVALARQAEPSGPALARGLLRALPSGAHLVVSSSLPVRELEWFGVARSDVTVHANRGANGIDGVVSTVVGVAAAVEQAGGPVVGLLGDLAFLHDANGLAGLPSSLAAVLVVVDNGGGGIFTFLPQHAELEPSRFEQLFGTPQVADVADVARAQGATVHDVGSTAEALASVHAAQVQGGVHVVRVRVDRGDAAAVHAALHDAVARSV